MRKTILIRKTTRNHTVKVLTSESNTMRHYLNRQNRSRINQMGQMARRRVIAKKI